MNGKDEQRMGMTNKEARDYLQPIADNARLAGYSAALATALRALQEVDELREQLKQYKDTGLDPHAVKVLAEFSERHTMADIDHLNQLAQAEKDGRLVVLPIPLGRPLMGIGDDYISGILHEPRLALAYNSTTGVVFHVPWDVFVERVKTGHIRALTEQGEKMLGNIKTERK